MIFYVRHDKAGGIRGVGYGSNIPTEEGHSVIGVNEYHQIQATAAHHWRLGPAGVIEKKVEVHLTADKLTFTGDGKDQVHVSWLAPKPVLIRINSHVPNNAPFNDSIVLTWDCAQHISLDVDDPEYFGHLDLEAL